MVQVGFKFVNGSPDLHLSLQRGQSEAQVLHQVSTSSLTLHPLVSAGVLPFGQPQPCFHEPVLNVVGCCLDHAILCPLDALSVQQFFLKQAER